MQHKIIGETLLWPTKPFLIMSAPRVLEPGYLIPMSQKPILNLVCDAGALAKAQLNP